MRIGSLSAWRAWFWRGRYGWAWVVLALAGSALLWLFPHTQDTIRRIGLAFEAVGVLVVVIEIRATTKKHGARPLLQRVASYFREAPPWQQTRLRSEISIALMGVSGTGSVGRPAVGDLTIEQRLDSIDKRLGEYEVRFRQTEARLAAEARARADEIKDEANRRQQSHDQLAGQIKEVAVGGLDLSAFGVFWLLLGMVLSTATPEVFCLLQWLGW